MDWKVGDRFTLEFETLKADAWMEITEGDGMGGEE